MKKLGWPAVAGIVVTLLPALVWAQQGQAKAVEEFGGANLWQVFGGLLLVILLFFACAWLMRRVQSGVVPGSKQMRVVGGLAVGTRERIVMVEVGEVQLLLGVAPGRVSTLHVFDEKVIADKSPGGELDFASKLKDILQQGNRT